VSSNDDPMSQELRALQEALEVVRFLRELQRQYANPDKRGDALRGPIRTVLEGYLRTTVELLGNDHQIMPVIDELLGPLVAGEEVNLDILQEDSGYIAGALETRFHLGSGGGYGGHGFSISQFPKLRGDWSSTNHLS